MIIFKKKSFRTCYQRFNADGRVVLKVETLPEFETVVAEMLRLPGIVTLSARIDVEKFYDGLIAKGIPQKIARTLADGLNFLEEEAYFYPVLWH